MQRHRLFFKGQSEAIFGREKGINFRPLKAHKDCFKFVSSKEPLSNLYTCTFSRMEERKMLLESVPITNDAFLK